MKRQYVLLFFFLSHWLVAFCQNTTPPNIIIILTDDQGYHDLGCYGAVDFETPNIDALAQSGVRLTQYYAAQPVCSASRASLLTGCYPNRIGINNALMPNASIGLNPQETNLANMLQQKGYATAIYGKWHLGDAPEFMPLNQGFDEYYGIPYSGDMWPFHPQQGTVFDFGPLPLYNNDTIIDSLTDQSFLTQEITRRSTAFIEKNAHRPFFLFVAHPQPHVPLFASQPFRGQSPRGLYGDVIQEIDHSVGEIVQTLRRLDLYDNSLIIFTSDNGPWLSYGHHAGSAFPFREGKATTWEGGVRVPFIAHIPGAQGGRTIDKAMMSIDILPTIAELVQAPKPKYAIDGQSALKFLKGEQHSSPNDTYFFYYDVNQLQAILWKNWKFILPHKYYHLIEGGHDGQPGKYLTLAIKQAELYNLSNDPSEYKNVIEDHAELMPIFDHLADSIRSELGDQLMAIQGSGYRPPGRIKE